MKWFYQDGDMVVNIAPLTGKMLLDRDDIGVLLEAGSIGAVEYGQTSDAMLHIDFIDKNELPVDVKFSDAEQYINSSWYVQAKYLQPVFKINSVEGINALPFSDYYKTEHIDELVVVQDNNNDLWFVSLSGFYFEAFDTVKRHVEHFFDIRMGIRFKKLFVDYFEDHERISVNGQKYVHAARVDWDGDTVIGMSINSDVEFVSKDEFYQTDENFAATLYQLLRINESDDIYGFDADGVLEIDFDTYSIRRIGTPSWDFSYSVDLIDPND